MSYRKHTAAPTVPGVLLAAVERLNSRPELSFLNDCPFWCELSIDRTSSSFDILAAARRAWVLQSIFATAACLVGASLAIAYWPWAIWACVSTPIFILVFGSAYGYWNVLCWSSRLKQRLRSSPLRFMEDASGRGILRKSGPSYRFRHVLLQYHLAFEALKDEPSGSLEPQYEASKAYLALATEALSEGSPEMARQLLVQLQELSCRDSRVVVDALRVQLRLAVSERSSVGVDETEHGIRTILAAARDRLAVFELSRYRRRKRLFWTGFAFYNGLFHQECGSS